VRRKLDRKGKKSGTIQDQGTKRCWSRYVNRVAWDSCTQLHSRTLGASGSSQRHIAKMSHWKCYLVETVIHIQSIRSQIYIYIYIYIYVCVCVCVCTHTHTTIYIHILHNTETLVGQKNKEKCDSSECLVPRKYPCVILGTRAIGSSAWLRGMTLF